MQAEWSLLQPYWLLLLPVIGLWLYGCRSANDWPSLIPPVTLRYPPLAHLSNQDAGGKADTRVKRSYRLTAAALALLLVSLAQPVQLTTPITQQAESEPVDLVLVVGTAISMRLRDYQVAGESIDRMSLAKQFLDAFVRDYQGRRIGLALLGNPPMLWLPLTEDRRAVRNAISRIEPVLAGRLTDTGATLALVEKQFAAEGETVVVLVSDGGLQLGAVSPIEAASKLRERGFILYVIGLGATGGEAESTERGGLLFAPVDLNLLQQLAEAGGGELFHARSADDFSKALSTIEAEHRHPLPAEQAERLRISWYPLPLGLAMLLLLMTVAGSRAENRRKR